VIDEAVAGDGSCRARAQRAVRGQPWRRCRAARRRRRPTRRPPWPAPRPRRRAPGRRARRAPGRHGGAQRAHREQPPPKPISAVPARNSRGESSGAAKITPRRPAGPPARRRRPRGRGRRRAPAARAQREGGQRAAGHQRGERAGGAHAQAQDLAAVGLEHDVLHVEGGRAQPDGPQEAACAGLLRDEAAPARTEGRLASVDAARRARVAASCFHTAMRLRPRQPSPRPAPPAPAVGVKSASSTPKTAPPPTMPTSSITYISATTRGRPRPARGRWPAPGRRSAWSAAPAHQQEGQRRGDVADPQPRAVVSPDSSSSAKGMIARPPNCSSVPIQM
jgi:hypothetical protein